MIQQLSVVYWRVLDGYQPLCCTSAVTVCSPGTYGYECEQRCNCSEPGQPKACHHVTGTCSCLPGLTGVMCDIRECSLLVRPAFMVQTAHMSVSAKTGAECNAKDGSCICPPGFYGASCSEVCPAGRYGTDCMKLCDCQNGAMCSPVDGKCECRPGFTGDNCEEGEKHHSSLLLLLQDCLQRCDCANGMHCDPSDGECICPPGKRGAKCEQDCEPGHFGAGCRGVCTCANGATCDAVSGACTCTPGWRGKRCDRPCPDGRYGAECRFICDCATTNDTALYNPFVARCDHITGDCRCPPGWTGPDCATPCPPGRWGSGCGSECECSNGATCDRLTGFCDCPAGFMGKNCETDASVRALLDILEQTAKRCANARMEPPVMQSAGTVHVKQDGEEENVADLASKDTLAVIAHKHVVVPIKSLAITSLASVNVLKDTLVTDAQSFAPMGRSAMVVARHVIAMKMPTAIQLRGNASANRAIPETTAKKVAPKGRFGHDCSELCDCANGALCDKQSGACLCPPGFIGTKCDTPCPPGRFGDRSYFFLCFCATSYSTNKALCSNLHSNP
ncbi:EGF-like domain protein [Ostertagia ostertagi]